MKKVMRKILVILVLMALLINSSLLMILSTALDAISEVLDESKINSILEMSLEKYINYNLDGQAKGTLVQMNVKTGIEYAEGQEYIPLEYTEALLQAPKIDGEYPEKVEFVAKSTKATNGDDNAKDIGYEYNNQDGTVKVCVQNKEDEQGNIYSENVNGARDEFVVLYYYGANCYNDENAKRELEFNGKITQIIHNEDKSKIEKEFNNTQEVTENISGLISTNVTTSDIYNGYINSNIANGTDLDTEYTENTQLNISYKEISDEILINQNTKFIDTDDKEVDTQDIVYKGVKINRQEIINVLGEDFKICILNDAGETITEINKDTEANENNIIDVNYDKEYTNINLKISKPVKEGYLQIENKKAIKSTMKTIENNKIKLSQEIICQNNIQEKNEQTGVVENEYTKQIYAYKSENIAEIQTSESKIELHSDKEQLTNSTKNDVVLTAILKTNDARYNLFKNPVIEIEMPSEVDNVILGDVSLLYDNNLNIKKYEVQDRSGIKVIRIEVEGTQLNYSNSVIAEGANIIIPATIIVNKDIYSTQSSIKMRYSNETGIITSYAKQGKDCEELQVNIDSMNVPVVAYSAESYASAAMATAYTSSNVSLDGLKIETTAQVGDTTLKDGDTVYEKEVINYIIKVTNTTENEMNNVNVKATVPDGTTYITKDGSWAYQGATDEASKRNDLEIKYEDKKDVTIDLEKIEAGSEYILKYSVIINDINDGEQKNIENKIYINDTEMENKINLVAKKGKMKIDLYPADKEYGKYKNMYIFEARVYNTSNEKITNVQLESTLATEMELNYVAEFQNEYDSTTKKLKINVGDIEANSSKLIAIRLNALNFKAGVSEYTIPFDLETYGDNTDTYRADTQYVKAYSADITVKMESPTEGQELEIGQEIEYNVTIKNTGTVNEYITVIDNLPEYVSPIKAKYNKFEYNSEGTEITQKEEEISLTYKEEIEGEQSYDFKLETVIPKDETINITIIGETDDVDKKTEVSNTVTVYGKETGAKVSNGIVHTILPYEFEEEGEGEKPDLSNEDLYGSFDDGDEKSPSDADKPSDEKNPGHTDDSSNSGSSTDKDNSDNTGNSSDIKYFISGRVWVDENQDGKRNSDEELLKGVGVKLFNADTNAIVTDKDGSAKRTETNDSGEYKFENIAKGNYLVIFEYDTNIYTTTKYQSSLASNVTNSDAIAKEVSIDGQNKVVGVTDILNISSSNIENIDIGLVKSQKFDFKLDKYVSKITVNNTDGTKEYSYKDSKLAKVEIASKKIANSTVQVEYKIVVTNEGELSGEINEIIDYLPDGMSFNSELNKGWYKGYDGNLRNSSLAENQIKPGESKELTLILTKNLTETSIGMIENIAEIGNATNVNYVSDIDSTPGNKKDGEDDYSKAQVIISIKTGIVQSIAIIFIILAILFAVAFVLKNKKIKKSIKFFTMFMAIMFIGGYSFVAKAEGTDKIYEFVKKVYVTYKTTTVDGIETIIGSDYSALWIEKTEDGWVYGPSYGNDAKMSKEARISPGFICISPGKHLCTDEIHGYDLVDVSSYTNSDEFFYDMTQDYYEGAWLNLSGLDATEDNNESYKFFKHSVTGDLKGELTKKNKSEDVHVRVLDEEGVLCGPFKYQNTYKDENGAIIPIEISVSHNGSSCGYELYTYDDDKKTCTKYTEAQTTKLLNSGDVETFYIKPKDTSSGIYFTNGSIYVQISVSGQNTITDTGVRVAEYNPDEDCKLGPAQSLIRLSTFSEQSTASFGDKQHWYVKLDQGKLIIKKQGENNVPVANIKFGIFNEAANKKYYRWTNEEGKIELNNIPIGLYTIQEMASENENYPIEIQSNLTIDDYNVIENSTNEEKNTIGIKNTSSYIVKINKYTEDDSGKKDKIIENANFIVQERDETQENKWRSISNLYTDKEGTCASTLNLRKDTEESRIYRISELKTADNYYLNPVEDSKKPTVIFKYERVYDKTAKKWNIKWYVLKNDLTVENDITNNTKESNNAYITYRDGVKIKIAIDGNNGIIVSFVNDEVARIEIKKLDAETGERLNGAGFKIYFKYTVEENGEKKEKKCYIKNDYEYDTETGLAKINWTSSDTDEGTIFTTGTDYGKEKYNEVYSKTYGCRGVIVLKGVPKKTYYAEEVKAPDGYRLSENVDKNTYKINWTTTKNGDKIEYRGYFGKKVTINNVEQNAITNESMRTIGIQKVDNERRDMKINGVKFTIYKKIYCATHKRSEKYYITRYAFDEKSNKMNIEWTNEYEADCKPIEFETGYNYLDGNTYFVNSKGETCYIQEGKQYSLSNKNFDGNKGEIILKGMESKVYYAKEIDTGNEYYKADTKKIYRTVDKCQGKDINWLIDMNIQEEDNVFILSFNRGEDATGGTEKVYIKGELIYSDATCENVITQIEIPQREGYRFLGYKFNEAESEYSFDSYGNFNPNGSLVDLIDINYYTGSLELKAVWEEVKADSDKEIYTIKFIKNGGTGGTDVIYVKDKMLYSDKECKNRIQKIDVPTKDGFTFKGYKLNAQEIEYDFNSDGVLGGYLEDLINLDMVCDMKLYAIWDTIYTIKLEKNGGTGGTDYIYIKDKKIYSDNICTNEITNITVPQKEGYAFKGYKFSAQETDYSIKSDGTPGKNFISFIEFEGYSQNMTLYAIWEEQIITNQQTYVDISGYVWNDGNAEKTTIRNNKYDAGEPLLKKIIVKLKDIEGNVVTNKDGNLCLTSTNDQGEYKFEKVPIEGLKNYYVEFTYNGLLYQNVTKETEDEFTQETTSKAGETTQDRDALNSSFAVIEKGVSKNEEGGTTHTLTYSDVNNHKSTFYFDRVEGCNITSKTDNYIDNPYGSYLNRRYVVSKIENGKETYEINNVNLGLYEREQPDMALIKDIENVQLCINDFEYTYEYAQRVNNSEYDGFNIDVKFGEKYAKMTYKRPIYESDYLWDGGDKELTAYITYRIQIRNESSSLQTRINSLVDYCSKTYKIEEIGTGLDEKNNITGKVGYEKSEYDDNYQKCIINVNTTIQSGKSKDIYVKFKLSREDIFNILGDKEHEGTGELLNNIVEINSYSIFDENDKIYAGIDKDSQPGNAIPGDISTYEDDTDSAPGFKIEIKTNRTISGTVFEDGTSGELLTGQIRQGNGIFDNDEKTIEGVKVTLHELNGSIPDMETNTDENGNFEFVDYIPGHYTITYTWGNDTYTVQNYKGTVYDSSRNQEDKYWYKDQVDTRKTDAIDNYDTRKSIDSEMKEVTLNTYGQYTYKKMASSTPEFMIDIEYKEINSDNFDADGSYKAYEIKNIDFGIVERARQIIKLTKNVSNFKIILPNETTELFNAKIIENKLEGSPSYVRYMPKEDGFNGSIITEIDNEIIQGATAEVTYTFKCINASEIDYQDEDYYLYGVIPENTEGTVIKITPSTIVDYLDNNWKYKEQNIVWSNDSKKDGEIQEDESINIQYNGGKKIKDNSLDIYYTNELSKTNKKLKPNDVNSDISLTVTKLLASNNNGITLDNDAEIVKVSKNGGAQVQYIPGNYEHKNSATHEGDDDIAETVTILPNTGKNLDFATPIIITILMLGILTTGIILIKKKVLGNKD